MRAHVESIWRRGRWVVVITDGKEVLWSAEAEPDTKHHRHVLGLATFALKRLRKQKVVRA